MGESNNKRIAKNATMLTIRMVITLLIGLYTSRVILNSLGVVDYGIYGVVGGVIGMFGFLNSAMSGATSRFLTYEMVQNNRERLQRTFSTALIAHVIIALIVLILSETIGLWFLNNKLNIPEERMVAANWLLQISIVGSVISIIQVPYNAMVIAYERMTVYAYLEILASILKLGIAFVLMACDNTDRLILYSILMLCITITQFLIYQVYCIRHFEASKFSFVWDTKIMLPIVKYSGLDLYGNISWIGSSQGRNMLINIFFGVAVNASVSIASTVLGVLFGFSNSILQAFRPPIIKQYAVGDISAMELLVHRACTFVVVAMTILCIPVGIFSDYLLKLWLGIVPPLAGLFLQLLLINSLIVVFNSVSIICIHATGCIKRLSIYNGTIILLGLPLTWCAYALGAAVWMAYVIGIWTSICNLLLGFWIIKIQIPKFRVSRLIQCALKVYAISAISFGIVRCCSFNLSESFLSLLLVTFESIAVVTSLSWIFLFDKNMRHAIWHGVLAKFTHFNK